MCVSMIGMGGACSSAAAKAAPAAALRKVLRCTSVLYRGRLGRLGRLITQVFDSRTHLAGGLGSFGGRPAGGAGGSPVGAGAPWEGGGPRRLFARFVSCDGGGADRSSAAGAPWEGGGPRRLFARFVSCDGGGADRSSAAGEVCGRIAERASLRSTFGSRTATPSCRSRTPAVVGLTKYRVSSPSTRTIRPMGRSPYLSGMYFSSIWIFSPSGLLASCFRYHISIP